MTVQLTVIEQNVLKIVRDGPVNGVTPDNVQAALAQNGYDVNVNHVRARGLKTLSEKGLIVKIGMRHRQTVWLDTARSGVGSEPQEHYGSTFNGHDRQQELVATVSDLIATRQALALYIREAITADGGHADPSWLARLIVRDWDIKPRSTS